MTLHVPDPYTLEAGGFVAPRVGHPASLMVELGDDWKKLLKRWAVPYHRPADDDEPSECYGDEQCRTEPGGCQCFVIVHWTQAKDVPPEQRQAIWYLP